jgi:uncharacterized integral membrane protein
MRHNDRQEARVSERSGSDRDRFGGLGAKGILGLAVAVLVVIFIAINRNDTEVSFIFFTANVELWVALAISAIGGFVAGFLISRKRYRS